MLRRVMGALAVATYTLAGAAMIVDARAEGGKGLPEGFPFLAQLREIRAFLQPLAGPGRTASRDVADVPRPPDGMADPTRDLPREIMNPGARPTGPVPERTGPGPPSGSSGVRVNRGLP